MEWRTFTQASQALNIVGAFLEQQEAENNLTLGILHAIVERQTAREPLLWMAEEAHEPVLFLLMTPPHHLILAGNSLQAEEAAQQAAERLLASNWKIPSVIGEPQVATAFANAWERHTRCRSSISMQQRIYKLEQVNSVPYRKGQLRLAEQRDVEIAARWIAAFSIDVREPVTTEAALQKATDFIACSSLYFWDDQGPVCMAVKNRPTRNGIVVSLVYTPPESRKKGYATSCVAKLSQLLLDAGYQFCSLYTDLANPTSNRIYQEIGYRPIQHSVVILFHS